MSLNDRKEIMDDMVHIIRKNGGRVHTQTFIRKCMDIYGRTEEKIQEYLRHLEATKRIKPGMLTFPDIELYEKSDAKPIEPKKSADEDLDLSIYMRKEGV